MSDLADRLEWMDEARQIAAQCWCDPETEQKIMDPVLAEAIAKRIALWMATGSQHATNEEYWRKRAADAEEAIAALSKTEPVAWTASLDEVRDNILNGRGPLESVLNNEQTNAVLSVFDELYAEPSRETDQRENSNPAPMHGQSKTGLTGSHPGAPTHQRSEAVVTTAESRDSCKQSLFAPEQQSFDHPTAEPALSAEHIEQIRRAYDGSKVMDSLCRMALSSLTARDEVEKMRRRVEMYRDKARGNHEAYLKLYADFVGIEGASHD